MPETLVQIALPELGESVTEGSIVEWRKKVGAWIEAGETLVDVTTDKVDVEVPAPSSGIVRAIYGAEGDTIAVGTVLADIDTSADKASAGSAPATNGAAPAAAAPTNGELKEAGSPQPATGSSYGAAGSAASPLTHANGNGAGIVGSGIASHHAQRAAWRHRVDLNAIKGTGPGGMVLREDVESAVAAGTAKPLGAPTNGVAAAVQSLGPVYPNVPSETKTSALKGPSAKLAEYMEASLTIPTATSFREIEVGVLEARRAELNAALKNAGRPEKVSFTHIIAFAITRAASEIPTMTSSFRRDGKDLQRVENGVHLGLAVDSSRKDGSRFLVVPVIKNAANLDFAGFRGAYEDLVVKARDGKLTADELNGASITLTNPGGIGTVASVPRLMVGQGAIIAAGAIAYPAGFRKAPESTLRQLGVEKVMTLTSTYDHRVIQGALSGEYLRRLDQLLAGEDDFYESLFRSFALTAGVKTAPAAAAKGESHAQAAAPASAAPVVTGGASDELMRAVAGGAAMVSAYRRHGHLAATLDPLGHEPVGDPSLDPRSVNLTPALMNAVPASILRVKVPGATLADVLPRLRETYSSTIAYEIEHISNTKQREWLRDYIESGFHRTPLTPDRKVEILNRLTKVETMERYFRKQFLSQKTFSIEGLDVMVPMLEEIISMLAEDGTKTAVLGMAHRGRLSTIAHVVNRQYEELLAEFEAGSLKTAPLVGEETDVTGDVKYHHGATGRYRTQGDVEITVQLANNPSHLEAVDGVVEGLTRALQTDHTLNLATQDVTLAAPILIHGDAAFSAQGIIAEVLNLQALPGYATGGTIHIISNNQVGFTTDPSDARSTRYASDMAKGFDVPIVHVNADDVDACIAAVHFSIDFRRQFGHDVIIDLIGYRRFGHNEQDEPAYTQPEMTELIKAHPTVRELFASQLVAQGVLTADQAKQMQDAANARMAEAHANVKEGKSEKLIGTKRIALAESHPAAHTTLDRQTLIRWAELLSTAPEGFTPNAKLMKQFERRTATMKQTGETDWGISEGLAFASLLAEGVPIRLTGQDTERGTFSHRHAVLHDMKNNEKYAPLQHLPDATASFEIYNSPLSEYACLGFEYGYATAVPDGLVLWEAQFGDFNNGAQIIIDQFIAAGAAKWGQRSRLTLLLPHGYEGAGPEHSSARLERFLQLSAEGNIRIANCSTASQYFHLLRAQAKATDSYPLVVMTPKSLLRNAAAGGNLDDLANGAFKEVIDDPRFAAADKSAVTRIILCSGKIYHDLTASSDATIKAMYGNLKQTAIVRTELLSPFPIKETLAIIATYANAKNVIWVQEEPKNMGARAHVRRRLVEELPDRIHDIEYIGRPYRASPSEGYPGAHAVEQERIIKAALTEA